MLGDPIASTCKRASHRRSANEFNVDDVVSVKRGRDGRILFAEVKWEGYSSSENTWVPISDLSAASRRYCT
jgi:hypothetical protein